MFWMVALIVLAPLVLLPALALKIGRTHEGWREEVEGLRERWESRNAAR
jgi:hypothetical protein